MMMRICNRFVHVDADDDFLGNDDDFFGHHDVFFCAATCHDCFCSNFQNFPDNPAKSSKFLAKPTLLRISSTTLSL